MEMMTLKRNSYWIIFSAIIWSCKGPQVVSFVSPTADFSEYETYRIVSPREGEDMASDTSALNQEIAGLIKKEIEARDYLERPRSDLRVQFDFIANSKTNINLTPDYYSSRAYSYRYNYPYRVYNLNQRSFYEAILIIELKNKKAKTVWQGSLDLRYTKKIKNKNEILPSAVQKIFSTYPYKAGSSEVIQPEEPN